MSLPATTYDSSRGGRTNRPTPRALPPALTPSAPVVANFPAANLILSAGAAIFHIASARIVLCYHTRDKYHFLPKGRKDTGESLESTAVREGWEESGYRCRLVGGHWKHRQPTGTTHGDVENIGVVKGMNEAGAEVDMKIQWSIDPVWTQLVPLRAGSNVQYQVFWYIAETLPPQMAQEQPHRADTSRSVNQTYRHAGPMSHSLTIDERISMEPADYEPPRMEGTGVDEEEMFYTARLVDIEEAAKLLGSVYADVIRVGWKGICDRQDIERASRMTCSQP